MDRIPTPLRWIAGVLALTILIPLAFATGEFLVSIYHLLSEDVGFIHLTTLLIIAMAIAIFKFLRSLVAITN